MYFRCGGKFAFRIVFEADSKKPFDGDEGEGWDEGFGEGLGGGALFPEASARRLPARVITSGAHIEGDDAHDAESLFKASPGAAPSSQATAFFFPGAAHRPAPRTTT
ncbi:hypothetical protein HMPREF9440_01357 [Sutterella parvirubra YIT 11816]|uniref:Uncharacterized protein n=1 Tax=Sutterella parvirubra YIT 11816 TaxID=762967 RepID=H3KF40_9BURK|nr:hypothetical protein HMPREF9440_01357 [Sutterella parvirubra YIT 11816]